MNRTAIDRRTFVQIAAVAVAGSLCALGLASRAVAEGPPAARDEFAAVARPLVQKYCLACHSARLKKGGLDLERFATLADARKDLKACQQMLDILTAGDMPPAVKPQPTADERKMLIATVRNFLDAEARARAGDPGPVPLRRLSNAEYDHTIRDLTGVDLRPAREFPADGAAGEGFTNAAEALTDVSPALFGKYLDAAKEMAAHAVLLPDGFRFSPGKSRRDWTDESTARLRRFYADFTSDGHLPVRPYLAATVRHRDALLAGLLSIEEVARRERLNRKYLGILWRTLTDARPSYPLDLIRARWRKASEMDIAAVADEVAAWQKALWKTVPIGSYRYGNTVRQVPNDAAAVATEARRLTGKAVPAEADPRGFDEFRACFPQFICFPEVIPTDEAVSLKMFHREDEPIIRLFLDAEAKRRIDRLWEEHRFISRQPVAENAYVPQFIGYVTQDLPKELLAYFESQRPMFRRRAEEFEREEAAAVPRQLDAPWAYAARAYRRPLADKELTDFRALYDSLRKKGLPHDEALRGLLTRVLVAPAFLFRIEQAPPGRAAGPVSDWELATRLSYFLWASLPDDELRSAAAAGRLHDWQVLAEQTRRMLKDAHVRGLAVEFGTQWIHVRGFDDFNEKNEKLFPTFSADLRRAINEESVLFFQHLFQDDGTVTQILDADHTYLNETLAKHYGIPGVVGPEWRRVEGMRKYGRGGILGLASVLAKQSGASRTSPVLRGNWLVETMLGEKLPRPPANVPRLPEAEGGDDGLTTRQRVERHASDAACAVCHRRIDPYGFALEAFDPIGRRRDRDLGGHPVDTRAKLTDGIEFADIDGLRTYLLTAKKEVFVRLFCRRLLGYALGRSVILSDTALIDQMVAELDNNDGRLSAAVLAIVQSPQFRMIRAAAYTE
jgi:hypothetical protein